MYYFCLKSRLRFAESRIEVLLPPTDDETNTMHREEEKTPPLTRQGALTLTIVIILLLLVGCHQSGRKEVHIGSAASLHLLLEEAEEIFEAAHEDVDLVLTYAASGSIANQIRNGAPIDLFISADEEWLDMLEQEGHIREGSIRVFAYGKLVIAFPRESRLESAPLCRITELSFSRIGIANPKLAPYGHAAWQALETCRIIEKIRNRLVYGENVAQVMVYLEEREVDLGLVPLSLAIHGSVTVREVDQALYSPIVQAIGVAEKGSHPHWATRFGDFLLSSRGRTLLEAHGFRTKLD